MITIAIELNNVVRNINKQLLKYYQRDYHPELDIDEIDDTKEDIKEKYIIFDSKRELNQFIYIDYPYEIFGCAKAMNSELPRKITAWIEEMANIEDVDFRVMFYSLDEEALTIQSTYFFLSKIGTRVREIVFPKKIEEIYERCNVIISSNDDVVNNAPKSVKTVKITNGNEYDGNATYSFKNLTEIIESKDFLNNIK